MAPPPAEPAEHHHHPRLPQRGLGHPRPAPLVHLAHHEVQVVPVQMHAFGDVVPEAVVVARLGRGHAVPRLVPPVDRVLEVGGHEVAVEVLSVADGESVQVRGAVVPGGVAGVEEFEGAVVDLAVRQHLIFPFGEAFHELAVLVAYPECHVWCGRGGVICGRGWLEGGDEIGQAVAEDDEPFFVGQETDGVLGGYGQADDGAAALT